MRVRATKRGFFVKLHEVGDTFGCPETRFSKKWMERVEEPAPAPAEVPVVETVAIGEPAEMPAPPAEPGVKKKRGRPRKPKSVSLSE